MTKSLRKLSGEWGSNSGDQELILGPGRDLVSSKYDDYLRYVKLWRLLNALGVKGLLKRPGSGAW